MVSTLPLVLFFARGIELLISRKATHILQLMDSRIVVLLIKTVFYSLSVAFIVVIFATLIAIGLLSMYKTHRKFFMGLLILLIPLPVTIHSMIWMNIFSKFQWIPLTGWGISIFVQSVAWLPIGTLIIYDAMTKIPKGLMEVGQLLSNDLRVFFKIWLPQSKTGMTIVVLGIFLMTFNDYSVPSTFAVKTFPMEIFASYSISLNAGDAMITGLPMLFLGLGFALPLVASINKQFFSGPSTRNDLFINKINFTRKYLSKLSMATVLIIIVLPFFVLMQDTSFSNFHLMRDGGTEILATLWICFGGALLALPIMILAAIGVNNHKNGHSFILLLILLPTLISPALIGAALIHLMNRPVFRWVYLSHIMGMLAVMIRFMPFGILVIIAGLKKIPEDFLSVGYITAKDFKKTFFKIFLPLTIPSIIIAMGLVFLLGLGELGTSVMVLPPGVSTITVRIFGYLHYGATELIAEVAIVLLAIIFIIELLLYKLIKKVFKNLRIGGLYDSSK
jgi:iron(III) transport system permease protein